MRKFTKWHFKPYVWISQCSKALWCSVMCYAGKRGYKINITFNKTLRLIISFTAVFANNL
jgi:hypothetical protein